jgi:O-acetyl-ADP-ribose deacetylase (regulator of RNase III)
MALKIVEGDVFNELAAMSEKGKNVIFVHGCNAQGVMGSGIAALVKKLYPFAFEAYRQEYTDFGLVVGDVVFGTDKNSTVIIANAITQKNYGRDGKLYVSYDAVVDTLTRVAMMSRETNVPVYFPMIGGGLGGGDRKRLIAIFEAVFHDVDATLYLKED